MCFSHSAQADKISAQFLCIQFVSKVGVQFRTRTNLIRNPPQKKINPSSNAKQILEFAMLI